MKKLDLNGVTVYGAQARNSDPFEAIAGRKTEYPVHNIVGAVIPIEAAVIRDQVSSYSLQIRLGDQVLHVGIVPRESLAHLEAQMTVFGPSSSDILGAQLREKELADLLADQEAQRRAQSDFALRRVYDWLASKLRAGNTLLPSERDELETVKTLLSLGEPDPGVR